MIVGCSLTSTSYAKEYCYYYHHYYYYYYYYVQSYPFQ